MNTKYDITCIKTDRMRNDIWEWLTGNLRREDYCIYDVGFLLSSYELTFVNPDAEVLFVLAWGDTL